MDDAEREEIIRTSRETVERLADLKAERCDPLKEDAAERWARQRPQPERPRRQPEPTTRELDQLRAREWAAFIDSRIDSALKPLREAVGAVIAQERRKHRDALAQLKAALQLQIDALAAEFDKQRALDDGSIIELPTMPLRKHRDAA